MYDFYPRPEKPMSRRAAPDTRRRSKLLGAICGLGLAIPLSTANAQQTSFGMGSTSTQEGAAVDTSLQTYNATALPQALTDFISIGTNLGSLSVFVTPLTWVLSLLTGNQTPSSLPTATILNAIGNLNQNVDQLRAETLTLFGIILYDMNANNIMVSINATADLKSVEQEVCTYRYGKSTPSPRPFPRQTPQSSGPLQLMWGQPGGPIQGPGVNVANVTPKNFTSGYCTGDSSKGDHDATPIVGDGLGGQPLVLAVQASSVCSGSVVTVGGSGDLLDLVSNHSGGDINQISYLGLYFLSLIERAKSAYVARETIVRAYALRTAAASTNLLPWSKIQANIKTEAAGNFDSLFKTCKDHLNAILKAAPTHAPLNLGSIMWFSQGGQVASNKACVTKGYKLIGGAAGAQNNSGYPDPSNKDCWIAGGNVLAIGIYDPNDYFDVKISKADDQTEIYLPKGYYITGGGTTSTDIMYKSFPVGPGYGVDPAVAGWVAAGDPLIANSSTAYAVGVTSKPPGRIVTELFTKTVGASVSWAATFNNSELPSGWNIVGGGGATYVSGSSPGVRVCSSFPTTIQSSGESSGAFSNWQTTGCTIATQSATSGSVMNATVIGLKVNY
jgi:hypothetical protein